MGGPGSGRRKKLPEDKPATTVKRPRPTRARPISVRTPTGTTIQVLTKGEQAAYQEAFKRYQSEFQFTSASDLEDLSNLLFQEVLVLRYQTWLGTETDYENIPLTASQAEQYRRNLIDISRTIHNLKTALGISRSRRMGEGATVADYLATLRRRALAFKVMRDKQAVQAIVLMKELQSQVRTFLRATTPKERKVIGIEDEAALIRWITDDLFPRFDAIDEEFRLRGTDPQLKWAGAPERAEGRA